MGSQTGVTRSGATRRPTIVDVGERAGVSRQTVSRVLADHPRVAEDTRRRVEEVIAELGFRPNRMAQALVTKTSLSFGIASVDMRNLHFAETCSGMQAVARERGYHLVITELDLADDGGIGTLETLLTLGVDGIVIFPNIVDDAELEAFAERCGCPIVMIGRAKRIPGVVSIALDEAGAAAMIVDHLLATGKRHIGLLMNELFPRIPHERYLALRQAIETALGEDTPPTEANEPTIAESKAAATRLITAHPDVDAIVAFNDTVAMGALAACHRLGLRVPRDISVVGYDGIPYGAATVPPLTTMLQDSFGMAGAAIRALLECARNGSPPSGEVQLWKPELLKRGTT
jgi:LacI family transcriptional regulator